MRITISGCNTEKPLVEVVTKDAHYVFDIGKDNLQGEAVHGLSPWGAGEIEKIYYNSETNRVRIQSWVHNPTDERRTLVTAFGESKFLQQYEEYKPASVTDAILNGTKNDEPLPY